MIAPIRVFCDAHEDQVGNPHPPACPVCDLLSAEFNILPVPLADRARERIQHGEV